MAAEDRKYKQVLVLRTDLKMPAGKMVTQGGHGVAKSIVGRGEIKVHPDGRKELVVPLDEAMETWILDEYSTKITVGVDSEAELLEIHEKALAAGIPAELITDAGLTCFGGVPTRTCLALGPDLNEKLDDVTGHLKLIYRVKC